MPGPPAIPDLRDDVVTLRAVRAEDAPAIAVHGADPQMARWTTVPIPYTRADAEAFVADVQRQWQAGSYLGLVVERDGEYAGTIDLRPDGAGGADVGYGLAPHARGRGTMSRAVRLVLGWAFEDLGLGVVHWRAAVGNWPSRRVAWACGFRVEGTVRALLPARGDRADAWVGSIRAGEPTRPAHPWFDPPLITGLRAVLRPHRAGDSARMAEACADPLTQQWLAGLPTPYTEDDARAHLDRLTADLANGDAVYWVVAESPEGPLCGEVALMGLRQAASRSVEVGYWAHPGSRGRGLTTEAVRLAVRHALLPAEEGGLGMDRVLLRAAEGNTGSQRVALAAGFLPAGRDRAGERLRTGGPVDLLRFDVTAEDLASGSLDRTCSPSPSRGGR